MQLAAHRLESQIYDGTRPIIGLNRYAAPESADGFSDLVRTPPDKQRRQIERVLALEKGHVMAAAERLGIPRSTLYQKLKELHIDAAAYRG